MPRLRSGKVVTGSEAKSSTWIVTSPDCLGAGIEHNLVKKRVFKKNPHLTRKRKPEQPFSSDLQPAILSSISSEQHASLAPVQKEQGDSSQRLPGENMKEKECRRTAGSYEGVALPISDTTVCEDWQAGTMAAAACWEETLTRGAGQGEQPFCSGATLQNNFPSEIERKEDNSEGLNLSSFQESSGSSGNNTVTELPMSASEEELQNTESHGVPCLPEPEVLQPRKGTYTTEMKSTDSIENMETQEYLMKPESPEVVNMPEKLDGCSLIRLRKPGTQKKGKKCLSKKGKTSWMKTELQGPWDRGRSALLWDLSGQEQTTARGKPWKCYMKEEQQSSNPQKGLDSLGESAKEELKAVEQDFAAQTVKKLKTNQNTSEDSKEKQCHYYKSPPVAALGVTNECSECEVQTEATAATTSSFTVSGLNHKEITQSASCDHPSDLHSGKKTCEVRKRSVWRKKDTELLAFEGDFKKTSELSVVAKGENSNNVEHHSAALAGLEVLAQVHDVSNSHKSRPHKKLNKYNKKLQLLTCQRTVPMTGKNVWPFESCARTSEWLPKKHGPVSERKMLLRADFKESSDESSVKAVGKSPVTGQLGHLDLCSSSAEIDKESTSKITDASSQCLTPLETSEYSLMGIYETSRMSNENVESLVNISGRAVAFNHDDEQEVKATSNFTKKRNKTKKGAVAKRSLSVTVQLGTSTGNTNRANFSHKVAVVKQTFSDLKPMKVLNTEKLTKFKIPLCRNKPKSRKLESGRSFERETCSPLEVLDSSSVSRKEKTDQETFSVNAKQQLFPFVSNATSATSMKKKADEINSEDLKRDGSENLSNEMSAVPERFSSYPYSFLDRPRELSVLDFHGTEHVAKAKFPDDSWNAADHPIALEINSGSKSRGSLPQHKSQNFPDILEAYKKDVLVIDVIQDDPDLFGTKDEKELALADSENCPLEAAYTSICIKDEKQDLTPEDPVISENKHSVCQHFGHIAIQESGALSGTENSCDWALKAKDTKPHQSSRVSSPLGGVTGNFLEDGQLRELDEFLKSFAVDEKFRFADGVPDIKQEKKDEAEKSSDCKSRDLVSCQLASGSPLYRSVLSEPPVMKPQANDYKFSGKSSSLPLQNYGDFEPWKMDQNAVDSHSAQQMLEMVELPRKYCRFYFMTLRGCSRSKCWFQHVPEQGDEKICMAILRTYISIKEPVLLKRAVQIFVKYYREVTPGMDFASQVLNELLISLLKSCLLQEVFQILNVTVQINKLPAVDVLLKIFEHVASLNIGDAVPTLISTFRKLVDAGMLLELEHFDYIIKFLRQLKVSTHEINTILNIKSRLFQERYFEKNWLFDFNLAVVEIQHCKEKNDWAKLGALYVNARTGCEHSGDFQKFSLCIAEILTRDSETDRPGVPFCGFADAVIKNLQHNEADRIFIGRTGISVMYSYHKVQQWTKGRKVLDKLHELQIHFTALKGLTDAERLASRCQIVNKAAEIFLQTGSLEGATWVLRESEWTTNAPLWPCAKTDILDRHNLLCTLVNKYLRKSLCRQAFEVLQNFPGFQNPSDAVDISQCSYLFNKLINACFESKNLGVSSSAVDFMLSKNISIDFLLLRGLITALGRSSLWSKARTYYKNALSMGCYPPLQGNLYHKRLMIPSYLSEIEMLLAIEVFLVSNASDIQSPMATSQTLQIILKRSEDPAVQSSSDYQAAVQSLILATRISDPKLLLKHMAMNVNMDEVYSLELASALKWLQENMKWAGKVWLFQ